MAVSHCLCGAQATQQMMHSASPVHYTNYQCLGFGTCGTLSFFFFFFCLPLAQE